METPIPDDVRVITMDRLDDGTWIIVLKGLGMTIGGFPIYNRQLAITEPQAGAFSGLAHALQIEWDHKGKWPFIPPDEKSSPEEGPDLSLWDDDEWEEDVEEED